MFMQFYMETNFKDTEIGKIPEDWEVVRLGDKEIAEIRKNKSINSVDEVAFISMELIPDSEMYVKFEIRKLEDVRSFTYCEAGDLLLAKITPCFENGKQGIVPDDIPNGFALATTEVFPITCRRIDRLFLFYVLKHPRFRKILEYSMRGTTGRKRVPKEAVENLIIPYPPLPEQRKIAEILSTVDQAIQKTDEIIAKTERLKKGLMQELLSGRVRVKVENGKVSFYRETRFRDTEIGKVPEDWEVVRLGDKDVAEIIMGQSPPSSTYNNTGEGLPFLQGKTEFGEIYPSPSIYCSKPIKIAEPNDILLSVRAPVGDVNIAPFRCCIGRGLAAIRPKNNKLNYLFLFYYLKFNGRKFEIISSGSTFKAIRKEDIENYLIPLPPLDEQKIIAEILQTVDKKLEIERKEKEKLERIKKGLMDVLLTGKVRVKVNEQSGT